METWFRGRFEARLDDKGRLRVPSSLRENHSRVQQVVITNSLFKGQPGLDFYTLSAWQKLEKRIAKLPSLKSEVQAFQRFYLSGARVLEYDSTGRILLPPDLRKFANLGSHVILVGMGEKIEIWNKTTWEQLYQGLAENFEETLQVVARLESSEEE